MARSTASRFGAAIVQKTTLTFLPAGTRTARRSDMIGSSVKPSVPESTASGVEGGGLGKGAPLADEAATVGLRLGRTVAAGIVGDEMRHFHIRIA